MKQAATSVGSVEQDSASKARATRARAAVYACAGWVLAVTSIKLLQGSPNDLPLIVQDTVEMDVGLKFQLVCAVELSIVLLAFVHPRWGWMLLTALYALFIGLLAKMIADGQTSCGCFGGAIKLAPAAMLAIDGGCLALMLATKPWSSLPAAAVRWPLVLAALAVAWVVPFVAFKNEQLPAPAPLGGTPTASAPGGAPADPAKPAVPAAGTANGGAVASTEPAKSAPAPWRLPDKLPEFQVLNPEKQKWAGKHLKETQLGPLLDVEMYPQDAIWILYRLTCEHCATELREIANDPVRAALFYVLVHIPEPNEQEAKQVDQLPPVHIEALLPTLPRGYIGLTPWTLEVEAGIVKSVKGPEDHDHADGSAPAKH